eukprot:10305766-Lingulodinium_polyedra.AAC.1
MARRRPPARKRKDYGGNKRGKQYRANNAWKRAKWGHAARATGVEIATAPVAIAGAAVAGMDIAAGLY